jgi:hypothetical protein
MAAASASASTSALPKGFKVVGRGSGEWLRDLAPIAPQRWLTGSVAGGVGEMARVVDEGTVQYGLCRFVLGSGSFRRNKLVFVHVQGESASAVKKGRLNTAKGDVKSAVGASHAEIQISTKEECTPEHFFETLSKVIKSDEMGEFSISKMKADYEAMIAAAGASGAGGDILSRAAGRKTAAEMGSVEASKALDAVKQPLGPFNWALFRAAKTLELHNAGSMSVNEMSKWLSDDQVLFGLLRMGFGAGKFRRVKWICLHWSGEKVSPVKRGQANALKSDILKTLEPYSLTVSGAKFVNGMPPPPCCRCLRPLRKR